MRFSNILIFCNLFFTRWLWFLFSNVCSMKWNLWDVEYFDSCTYLTPGSYFVYVLSKWNMGEIFGLNFHLSYLHTPQNFFLWNPSMGKNGNFCYWINPLLAQVKCANLPNESNLKRNNFCTIRFLVLIYSYKAMLPIFPSKNMLKVSVNKQKLSGNWKPSQILIGFLIGVS